MFGERQGPLKVHIKTITTETKENEYLLTTLGEINFRMYSQQATFITYK